jgi:hypothetical protein
MHIYETLLKQKARITLLFLISSEPRKQFILREKNSVSQISLNLFEVDGKGDIHEVFLFERLAQIVVKIRTIKLRLYAILPCWSYLVPH